MGPLQENIKKTSDIVDFHVSEYIHSATLKILKFTKLYC